MDDKHADVIRLLRLPQTGHREQALLQVDEQLRVRESPGLLNARGVALHSVGDHDAAAQAAERILALTAGEMTPAPTALADQADLAGWPVIADRAMYAAKRAGRRSVSSVDLNPPGPSSSGSV